MKRHAALILMLGTLSLVACRKKDGDATPPAKDNSTAPATKEAPIPTPPPPAGSGSAPAATPPPAAGAGGCADGAWKDPAGVYCIKVPEGIKPPKDARKTGHKGTDVFDSDDNTFIVTVYDDPAVTFDGYKKQYGANGNDVVVSDSGDYDGGNGFFATGHNDAKKEVSSVSVVKSGTKVITCQAVASADKPLKPADACKSLHAL